MTKSPFSKAEMSMLRRMASALKECEQQIEQAKAAGLQCDDQCARCQHLREAYDRLINVYDRPEQRE